MPLPDLRLTGCWEPVRLHRGRADGSSSRPETQEDGVVTEFWADDPINLPNHINRNGDFQLSGGLEPGRRHGGRANGFSELQKPYISIITSGL